MMRRRTITRRLAAKLLYRFRYTCQMCCEIVDDLHEFDHVVPLWAGGRDDDENLQLLCYGCHGRKSRDESDMRTKWCRVRRTLLLPTEVACWRCCAVYSRYFRHVC